MDSIASRSNIISLGSQVDDIIKISLVIKPHGESVIITVADDTFLSKITYAEEISRFTTPSGDGKVIF